MSMQENEKTLRFDSLEVEAHKIDPETTDSTSMKNSDEEEGFSRFLPLRLPLFHWKTFLLFSICTIAIIGQWFFTSELFVVPQSIATSRREFFAAKDRYFQNASYWDAKQKQFDKFIKDELKDQNTHEIIHLLREAPPEVFVSFLITRMHMSFGRNDQIAIYPKENSSSFALVISKYEQGIWPLKIMLSLEVELHVSNERFSISFNRLRRGSQDLALGLCWAYFGSELERLRELELTPLQAYHSSPTSNGK